MMKVRPGGRITLRLRVEPEAPTGVSGYLFNAAQGDLIADLGERQLIEVDGDDLECIFELPDEINAQSVCLVVEGRWAKAIAGAEINFQLIR